MEISDKTINQLKYLSAGAMAGVVSRTATAPLERVKIFSQVNQKFKLPPGIFPMLSNIYRQEGLAGYFKGNGTNCLKVIPSSGIKFLAFENYKKLLLKRQISTPNQQKLSPTNKIIAGSAAGLTALSATYPLDLIRTRLTLQTNHREYRGLTDAAVKIIKKDGVKGYYRGFGTAAMSVVPFSAINFASYETLKEFNTRTYQRTHQRTHQNQSPPVWMAAANGAGAGVISMTTMYPMDSIKRRMMAQGFNTRKLKYHNGWDAFWKIVRNEGPLALYRGLTASYLKVVPTVSLTWFTYESCKKFFNLES